LLLAAKQVKDALGTGDTAKAVKAVLLTAGKPYLDDQAAAWVRQMARGGFVREVDGEQIVGFSVAEGDGAEETLAGLKAFSQRAAKALQWVGKHGDGDMPG
jgi:hypothetical protein